jgi:hypothetical protein
VSLDEGAREKWATRSAKLDYAARGIYRDLAKVGVRD